MNCKFCNAELEEGMTLCPECGKENLEEVLEQSLEVTAEQIQEVAAEEVSEAAEPAEEAVETTVEEPKRKPKIWVSVLAVIGALAVLAVLVLAVLYGTGALGKKAKSYTVDDAKAANVRNTVVATVGDEELTNSALQVYYQQSINEFYNYYGQYLDASVLDLNKPLDTQFYDVENGVTWQMYFVDTAMNTWSRYAAMCMQAKEDGMTMSEDMQAYMDAIPDQLDSMAMSYGYESAKAMLEEDMGAVCDEQGYLDYMYTIIYAGQYLDSIYADLLPTDAEIVDYYAQNEAALAQMGITNDGSVTVDARHILICPQGGTTDDNGQVTYSEEEWEQCRVKAQEILDKWVAEDGTEEGFAQLAAQYTEDPGSMSTGGLYTDISMGQMVEPFENWCFDASRKSGDYGLVRTNYGYHIMYFVGSEEIWLANVRDTMVNERSLAIVDGAVAKWPLEVNHKRIAMSAPKA